MQDKGVDFAEIQHTSEAHCRIGTKDFCTQAVPLGSEGSLHTSVFTPHKCVLESHCPEGVPDTAGHPQ